ncbi:ArsB/NhaD family transporter [Candidatus Culexarchaeum yellowstonense]|uniref:ArsB/NhaD family transporter n=1 Tax=Candidatus Culexarchaeum yellowstonense TaxID=2928963 RepID=UPI0026EB821C|nr:ArsB/NhaD family transporter [Candidatus Culexarchaeum yellowstonense]
MSFKAFISLAIFIVTLYLMIKRPKGISLGLAAGIGATASLIFGTISLSDAIDAFYDIWDAALAFIGIVTLSVTLDAMGFFKWAAVKVAKLAGGSGLKLYFYIALLTACVSILFANDSAVLILTPIVIEIISQLKIDERGRLAYLFSAGLIADTAAMPLITSNPINIVSADFFKYSFIDHLLFMGPVALVTIVTSLIIVYLFFRKRVPKSYPLNLVEALDTGHIIPRNLLMLAIATLAAIDVGYVFASLHRIPVSLVICSGAIFLLVVYIISLEEHLFVEERKGLKSIARDINWDIILFMLSIFLVVQGLRHVGAVDFIAYLFMEALKLPSVLSSIALSFIVTVGASFMNNWPMTILGLISIEHIIINNSNNMDSKHITNLIFSNIIGNNLGPHFFPLGSLAILMWLETMRRKGMKIKLIDYLRVGSVVSIFEVVVASIILWIEIDIFHMQLTLPSPSI